MSKAYVPPHKRKEAPVSLIPSDFPSLCGDAAPKAGAGEPSYVSKAAQPELPPQEKSARPPVQRSFHTSFKQERIVEEKYVAPPPPISTTEGEWVTKESKSSKKTKPDSDWDGFEDY